MIKVTVSLLSARMNWGYFIFYADEQNSINTMKYY